MDVTVTKSGHGDPFPDDYQGITGVLGVLCFTADKKGFKTESIWATSPHYLPKGISPKTTLSLVYKLEDILNITIPTKELVTVSDSWEKEINIYIKDNNEMEEYVKRLEKRKQQSDISKTTGETLAEEAERYLRHYNAGDI
jgi:predicted ATP-grasp superfamily ATP-dependent carboligase